MVITVGVSDMKVSSNEGDILVTYSLGTCVAIAVNDPASKVVGLLHYQLPSRDSAPGCEFKNPYMFAETGIPILMKELLTHGASRKTMSVMIIGGASIAWDKVLYNIGEKNCNAAHKYLREAGVVDFYEETGGEIWRTVKLYVGSKDVVVETGNFTS